MEFRSIVVAFVFGVLMAWAMTKRLDDIRPFRWATAIGTGIGGVVSVFSLGTDPAMGGGSLVIGCGVSFLISLIPRSTPDKPVRS